MADATACAAAGPFFFLLDAFLSLLKGHLAFEEPPRCFCVSFNFFRAAS